MLGEQETSKPPNPQDAVGELGIGVAHLPGMAGVLLLSQLVSLEKLIAVAVKTCCKWVLAQPL